MRLIETWLADQDRAFDLFAKFPVRRRDSRTQRPA